MNEERIIALAKTGDRQAFGELVDRYQRFVWNVALRMTGDNDEAWDISQEVFVTVWQKLAQFRERHLFPLGYTASQQTRLLALSRVGAAYQVKHSHAGIE